MKTMVAIPCMDQTCTLFDQCLDNLTPVGEISITRNPGSLVYVSRNALAEVAVKEGMDFVLWIDSDMVFTPDLMQRLMKRMEEGYDIVAPICFRRRAPFAPVIYKRIQLGIGEEDSIVEGYARYPRDSFFEVAACGFGCVMMRTAVLAKVLEEQKCLFTPFQQYGEDISFCLRARRSGFKIMCDSSIKLGHVSQSIVTEETYLQYRRSLEEQHGDDQ